MTKLIIAVVGGSLLISGVMIFGFSNQNIKEGGKIEIISPEYDFGEISMAAGKVSHSFEIKNAGDDDLEINEIATSCDCTAARLKVGEEVSREFGMHTSSLGWSQKIAPGQTGLLEVIFDPAFHGPQGTGPITRAAYLSTSDPQNKKAQVIFSANVNH